MNFAKILAAMADFQKYAPAALLAAHAVEAAVGAGNGASKLQIATAIVIGITHAGEIVPVPQVQIISTIVEVIVGTLNGLGALGKAPIPVAVPTPPIA